MRAPRTTMPRAVLADLVQRDLAAARRDVGLALVDGRVDDRVREREVAAGAARFWNATRFAAPASLPNAPHSSLRPAKPANVTFM